MARCGTICALLVALVSYVLYDTLKNGGAFRTLTYHGDAGCFLVDADDGEMRGPEDLAIVRRGAYRGLLFTAGDHRHSWTAMTPSFPPLLGSENGTEKKELCTHPTGAVYALDMNQEKPVPVRYELVGLPNRHFHPHGMKVRHDQGDDSKLQLFFVNHGIRDSIDVFDVDVEGRRAVFVRSYTDPLLGTGTVNNVAIADNGEDMYVTNWLRYPTGTLGNWFEVFGQRKWGTVVHCKLQPAFVCRLVEDALRFPNGLMLSTDNRQLFVATHVTLRVYTRNTADGSLAFSHDVPLPTAAADNVDVHPSGDVTIGAHPNVFMFIAHAKSSTTLAPSQVIRVKHSALESAESALASKPWSEPILHDGTVLPASTAAVLYQGRYVVGTVFARGVMVCPDPEQ